MSIFAARNTLFFFFEFGSWAKKSGHPVQYDLNSWFEQIYIPIQLPGEPTSKPLL